MNTSDLALIVDANGRQHVGIIVAVDAGIIEVLAEREQCKEIERDAAVVE